MMQRKKELDDLESKSRDLGLGLLVCLSFDVSINS